MDVEQERYSHNIHIGHDKNNLVEITSEEIPMASETDWLCVDNDDGDDKHHIYYCNSHVIDFPDSFDWFPGGLISIDATEAFTEHVRAFSIFYPFTGRMKIKWNNSHCADADNRNSKSIINVIYKTIKLLFPRNDEPRSTKTINKICALLRSFGWRTKCTPGTWCRVYNNN